MSGTNFFNTQENVQEKRSMEQNTMSQRKTSVFGVTEKRTTENTANVLLIDVSGSTTDKIGRGDSRQKLVGMKESATAFIFGLPQSALLGIVSFGDKVHEISPLVPIGKNKLNLVNAVQSLVPDGSTPMTQALVTASNMFGKLPSHWWIKRLYDLTDGIPDHDPRREAEQLKRMGVQLHTIGFGDGQCIDECLLREMASVSGNGDPFYYHFLDSGNLTVFMKRQSVTYTN